MTAPVTAQLILISGDSTFQSVIELHSVNRSIGRGQNCDIVWGSLQISRKHATLEYMLPKWYIRDTSTNGLSVNNTKLVKGELVPLNDADIISFIPTGSVRYRFRYVYNSPPRRLLSTNREGGTISISASSSSPQPSTSRAAVAEPATNRRPSVEEIVDRSDSEESNHSESLLDLDPPEDFLSFSADENDELLSPSALDMSDDSSSVGLPPSTTKRKHTTESDSDQNSIDRKKKRRNSTRRRLSSSEEDSRGSSCNQKSDIPVPTSSSNATTGLSKVGETMTEEQIEKCNDVNKLQQQLRYCMTTIAENDFKMKKLEFERDMERDEYNKKTSDVESITTAIKEENFKKILELLESELSCSVCNEVFIQATVIDCGHTFCSFCINEWSKKKMECCICRKQFRNKSRHVELENFITRMYDSFNEEISTRRKNSITEREDQAKKAEEARAAAAAQAAQRLGGLNPNGHGHHGLHHFMRHTAESYVDFLAELHNFNELLGPRQRHAAAANAGRGNGGGAAADRRRSARIQVRDAAPEANDAAARPQAARRGRNAGPRSRRNAAAIDLAIQPVPAGFVGAAAAAARAIPEVVDLDESNNAGGGGAAAPAAGRDANNVSPFARIPNQFFNLFL